MTAASRGPRCPMSRCRSSHRAASSPATPEPPVSVGVSVNVWSAEVGLLRRDVDRGERRCGIEEDRVGEGQDVTDVSRYCTRTVLVPSAPESVIGRARRVDDPSTVCAVTRIDATSRHARCSVAHARVHRHRRHIRVRRPAVHRHRAGGSGHVEKDRVGERQGVARRVAVLDPDGLGTRSARQGDRRARA